LLPIFGTIGLILIVLDGSLELELNRSQLSVIKNSSLLAIIPMLSLAFFLALLFYYFGHVPYKTALVNAIPFCVISSAIAIPSVRNQVKANKEFIIYESSLSDIFGVLFFNFIALNEIINSKSVLEFFLQLVLVIIISFVSVLGLSYMLSRIRHHITFTPIILLVILIYAISKLFHLPALIFIIVFGLFLGNLDDLKRFNWIEKLRPEKLEREVIKFKEITMEATFLIRALFFILFGFLMEAKEIVNLETLPWALAIIASTMLFRWITLKLTGLPVSPLLFVSPRGLITILLFLAITPAQAIPLVNKSLIIQTIILSVFIMMYGLMKGKKTDGEKQPSDLKSMKS